MTPSAWLMQLGHLDKTKLQRRLQILKKIRQSPLQLGCWKNFMISNTTETNAEYSEFHNPHAKSFRRCSTPFISQHKSFTTQIYILQLGWLVWSSHGPFNVQNKG